MTAVGYVGVEPEGLRALASAVDAVEAELGFATARIGALLDEAGESADVAAALRDLADELNLASADIRERAAVAEGFANVARAPRCVVPWWDPLRRAAVAVASNVWSFGSGTVDSFAGAGSTVWRLTPINGEWRQEWVDLAAGLRAAKEDWRGALDAAAGMPEFEERGWSYWLGGVVPNLALSAAGGLGVANRASKVMDAAGEVGDVANKAERLGGLSAAALTMTRRGVVEGDYVHPSLFGRRAPDPDVEPIAKRDVLKIDEEVGGHHAARHGPETTLEQQYERAMTGLTPDGDRKYPIHASRFLRWEDQRDAIERARPLWNGGEKVRVEFDHVVGDGYMRKTGEYRETRVALVKFTDGGEPLTSFPDLREGHAVVRDAAQ